MTKKHLWSLYKEELACVMGSTQMIKFGFGLKFAIEGYEIPEELYPLPTSKYLAGQYKSCGNLDMWGQYDQVAVLKRLEELGLVSSVTDEHYSAFWCCKVTALGQYTAKILE